MALHSFFSHPFFLTNGGESALKVMVRAAHRTPAIASKYIFLPSRLFISARNDTGEIVCWT